MTLKQNKNKNTNKFLAVDLMLELNISDTLAKILVSRGIRSVEEARSFLKPTSRDFHDPFLFNDMSKVVDRINKAIKNQERIVVYGDYDVDGITGTSILYNELKSLGAHVGFYIPNRQTEGYGINKNALDFIYSQKVSLIITVDCGITSIEEISYIQNKGVDVIVTDHHEPLDTLPQCVGVINGKVEGEGYPYKELSGAGIAGKLVHALSGLRALKRHLPLMALATVADIVPLTGENRTIVYAGLSFINNERTSINTGLKKLIDKIVGNSDVNSYHFGFGLGPAINASGRVGNPRDAVHLFITENHEEAEQLADKLIYYNEQRKDEEKEIYNKVKSIVNTKDKIIIQKGNDWNPGVIGIVASRLVEEFNKPSIILTYNKDDDTYSGSCRSIKGINMHDLLSKNSNMLVSWGGHEMAAGLKVHKDNLDDLISKLKRQVEQFDDDIFEKIHFYDYHINIKNIEVDFFDELKRLEPTGEGNNRPSFALLNVEVSQVKQGKSESGVLYYTGVFKDKTGNIPFVGFNNSAPLTRVVNAVISPALNNGNLIATIHHYEEVDTINLNSNISYGVKANNIPIETLNIPQAKINQLKSKELNTIHDLLLYSPRKYHDFRKTINYHEAVEKEFCAIEGTIMSVKPAPINGKMVSAEIMDNMGATFRCTWFNQNYVYNRLHPNRNYIFCGEFRKGYTGRLEMFPTYFDQDVRKFKRLIPVYSKIRGMSDEYLMTQIDKGISMIDNSDYLTKDIVDRFDLMTTKQAYATIHKPNSFKDVNESNKRHVFDILFKFNFKLKNIMNKTDNASRYPFNHINIQESINEVKRIFPYELTRDQDSSILKMIGTINDNQKLNALVQGDVGSGKTIVAFIMMYLAHKAGYQSTILAPTTVVARQHFDDFKIMGDKLGVNVELLLGSTRASSKGRIIRELNEGKINMIVGTHAVIQDDVIFNDLGLVVIDEQHRFGVDQRRKFDKYNPHMITMSATPIPGTLSMAFFGDNIQVLNIKTKPAGRKDIITTRVRSDDEAYSLILKEVEKGRQVYVVCPLIDESDAEVMEGVRSVSEEVEALNQYFKDRSDIKISSVSGKLSAKKMKEEIDKFSNNETQILVSTTVIEVGVNIPNASLIVLKNSERFGLAQAHQLRGRVGRGNHQSYCLLQTNKEDDPKYKILTSTSDGFEIAREDLKLRGPGDFIGTNQTGYSSEVMLMLNEQELYKEIALLNDEIYNDEELFSKFKWLLDE